MFGQRATLSLQQMGRWQDRARHLLSHTLRLQASSSDIENVRLEQSRTLAATAFLFAAIGISSAGLILVDFRQKMGLFGLSLGTAIIGLYVFWTIRSLSRNQNRSHRDYISLSTYILLTEGILWGIFINYLSSIASDIQRNIVTAIIMALVSAPMLGAPFTAAMAFWIPVVIAAVISVTFKLQPFDNYMLLCFGGYLVFTFGGIVFINRTLLERSIGRVRLQHQNEMFGLFLRDYEENTADWFWETDSYLRLCRVPERLAKLLKSSREALEGRPLDMVLGLHSTAHAASRELAALLLARSAFRDLTIQVELAGEMRWWCLTGRPVIDDRACFKGYRGVASDVTDAYINEQRVQYLASYDTLTGLINRQVFLDQVQIACNRASSIGAGRPTFALLLLDLDRFKEVNDSYGHATGDALLVIVGERLRSILREGDVVARLGGDEFAILLPTGNSGDAADIAERLIVKLGQRFLIGDAYVTIGASFGIAMFPANGTTPNELFRNVDLALYSAKGHQRGTYQFYEPEMSEAYLDRAVLQSDLQDAIGTDQLYIEYQPILDLDRDVVVSFEALLRWEHPTRGIVPPTVFIPLAEEAGTISRIGEFVLRAACKAAAGWAEDISVAVNLSPVQFTNNELVDMIKRALLESNLSPGRLELEITEGTWLAATQGTLAQLDELEQCGVKLLLDDFGTGFSSLSALRQFHLHGLKIDSSFVHDLVWDSKAAAIIRSIARLASEIDLSLTVEGVETAEQLALLRRCGIKRAQGFFFGRPQSQAAAQRAFKIAGC